MRIGFINRAAYIFITITMVLISGFVLNGDKTFSKKNKRAQVEDCTFNDIPLYGKVQFVESHPDIKVKVVESFPDLKVKIVDSFPDECGKWQIVDSFPDFKVQIVESFPDLKIKFVDSFPGLP